MKEYRKRHRAAWFGALICIFLYHAFGVVLQFFKGDVLDHAIAKDMTDTIKCGLLLISFILGECLFFFLYKRCSARYVAGCTRLRVVYACSAAVWALPLGSRSAVSRERSRQAPPENQ